MKPDKDMEFMNSRDTRIEIEPANLYVQLGGDPCTMTNDDSVIIGVDLTYD
jgi:glutaredoxin-related protein